MRQANKVKNKNLKKEKVISELLDVLYTRRSHIFVHSAVRTIQTYKSKDQTDQSMRKSVRRSEVIMNLNY